jgi:ribosomal protein L12E/L44/L45/RPP1/RPP2
LIHHVRARQSDLEALAFLRLEREIDAALNNVAAAAGTGQAATAADASLRKRSSRAGGEKQKRREKKTEDERIKAMGAGWP